MELSVEWNLDIESPLEIISLMDRLILRHLWEIISLMDCSIMCHHWNYQFILCRFKCPVTITRICDFWFLQKCQKKSTDEENNKSSQKKIPASHMNFTKFLKKKYLLCSIYFFMKSIYSFGPVLVDYLVSNTYLALIGKQFIHTSLDQKQFFYYFIRSFQFRARGPKSSKRSCMIS